MTTEERLAKVETFMQAAEQRNLVGRVEKLEQQWSALFRFLRRYFPSLKSK